MATPSQSDRHVRVGLVGTGSLGIRLARQFDHLPNATLTALADVDERNLAAAGRELSVDDGSRYPTFEAMIENESLDATAIATPNGLHYKQICTALQAGLHVLCEKPLATSVEDAYDLLQRSAESEHIVMIGYQRHLNPAFMVARERWACGDAEPTFLTGEITHDWRTYYEHEDDWRMDPELSGGGHLLNVGSHVIDAMLWTSGLTPTHVNATVDFHDEAASIDKQSSTTIEFENGSLANVSDTGIVARTREHIHIWDDDGAVYMEGRDWGDRTGYIIEADGTERASSIDDHDRQSKAAAFVESVVEGATPPVTVHDGFRTVVVTMAAYESGRRNERVDLRELYPFIEAEALGPFYPAN